METVEELKNITKKTFELIYLEENGEVKYISKEYENYLNLDLEYNGKIIALWQDDFNEYGYFENRLYSTKTKLYLKRIWKPNTGYCWSEVQIYILK
jgi:hypothetical protein